MKLITKRINKRLPLPDYEKGAACFDLVCRKNILIKPKELKLVPANIVIRIPEGYAVLIFARSSTPIKKGLILANGVGVLDPFYCGDKDEIVLEFFNFTDKEVKVKAGERLAQGMLIKHETVEWNEVERMGKRGRGGYDKDLTRASKR